MWRPIRRHLLQGVLLGPTVSHLALLFSFTIMTALRRIQKELKDIRDRPIDGLTVEPDDDNLFEWKCTIKGASDSPYKSGTFHFTLSLPENFPFKAPSVTFKTKIYHPGINEEGHICVPVLRDQNNALTMEYAIVLVIIQEKLNNPSPDDPFAPEIAAQLKEDKPNFLATAKEWTKKLVLIAVIRRLLC
ncbi:Ubiquitin-conjugating enzyme E2 [Grifola frondosa]|uniref:Ubiquitin-conjugating enzyme E2 n=1 Tax=Grifola frondosa TaxID=5627 RepID=A0A1C7MG26_GRIFR|nr:Ubiquitin-conjugating enzyme E2 [Grifola frondosa]